MKNLENPKEEKVRNDFNNMIGKFIPAEEDGHDLYLDQMDIEELHGVDTDEDYRGGYDD